jgi:hypothetical protein
MNEDNSLQKVITRCWDDEAFKERLLADPAATLAEAGVEVPEGVTVRVVVESATERALVVPPAPARELGDAELAGIHGGEPEEPEEQCGGDGCGWGFF